MRLIGDKRGFTIIEYMLIMTVIASIGFQIYRLTTPALSKLDDSMQNRIKSIQRTGM